MEHSRSQIRQRPVKLETPDITFDGKKLSLESGIQKRRMFFNQIQGFRIVLIQQLGQAGTHRMQLIEVTRTGFCSIRLYEREFQLQLSDQVTK